MLRTALLSAVALGLGAQTPAPQTAPQPAPAPKAEAKAAPAPAEDPVIGSVGGVAIKESEMNAMFGNMNPQQRQQLAGAGREKMVQNYLEFRLLVAKGRKDGLDKTPDYAKKLEQTASQLLASELLQKSTPELQKKTNLSDDDVKAYFETHKADFKVPGKFSARHILIPTKGSPSGGDKGLTEEEALKKATEVKAEFAKGGKWDDLAKKYSEDPGSKDKGGLYEGIAYGQFVPEFEEAVKKQEVGKVGEPVKSMFGYHVIQVESRNEGEIPAFDAVKEQAKQKATAERQEKVWNEFIAGIKKEIPFSMAGTQEGAKAAPAPAAKPAPKPAPKPEAPKTKESRRLAPGGR
ncbi:MAG: peptidylprolyl isomerase [Acidobacteria bacterium]|nr:peptidylprolyl isomerase [Acidobacteriota bacterium]